MRFGNFLASIGMSEKNNHTFKPLIAQIYF